LLFKALLFRPAVSNIAAAVIASKPMTTDFSEIFLLEIILLFLV
jgi:hypothetical protein